MRVGYVVKEFPKVSETFICREILELERQGFEVTVMPVRATSRPARHGWIDALRAEVIDCRPRVSFSRTWKALKSRADAEPYNRDGIRAAVAQAFDCPNRSGRSYLGEAAMVAEAAADRSIGHLHAHFANHPTFVAMLAHMISGASFSFTAHAKDIYAAAPTRELWREQLSRAAFAVTVSDANRDHIVKLVGSDLSNKVRRLYNGVDLKEIRPRDPRSDGPVRVLFAGRLIEKKGADLFIEAAAILRNRGIDAIWTVLGGGPLENELRHQATRLGVEDRVRFVGTVPHESVIEELGRSTAFVLPCRVAADGDRDALPTVLLEATAAGVPAVSTPVNGVTEIIDNHRTGLVVHQNDAAGIATATETLIREPLLRRRMSLAARRRAEKLFDATRNVGELADWFGGTRRAGGGRRIWRPSGASATRRLAW